MIVKHKKRFRATTKGFLVLMILVCVQLNVLGKKNPPSIDIGVGIGATSYIGEFNNNPFAKGLGPEAKILIKYNFNAFYTIGLIADFGAYTVYSHKWDDLNLQPPTPQFQSELLPKFSKFYGSVQARMEFNFLPFEPYHDLSANRVAPYTFLGVGVLFHDFISINDQSRGARGRAFPNEPNAILTLPFGIGVKGKVTPRLTLGFELTAYKNISLMGNADILDSYSSPVGEKAKMFHNNDWIFGATFYFLFKVAPKTLLCPAYKDPKEADARAKKAQRIKNYKELKSIKKIE